MDHLFTTAGLKLFEIVLPTLATALAGLLIAFLTKKLQSIGITVDAQQQAQLKELAAHTVIALEEQARRTPMSGQAKDSAAFTKIRAKLPDAKPADVRDAIDAALPASRSATVALVPATPGTFGRPTTLPGQP